jgi:hypothetical protein
VRVEIVVEADLRLRGRAASAEERPKRVPGKAAADYANGADVASEALIATWVSLAGPPVLLVRPYVVAGATVVWLDKYATDSRFTPGVGPVQGAVPTLLQHALQASRGGMN